MSIPPQDSYAKRGQQAQERWSSTWSRPEGAAYFQEAAHGAATRIVPAFVENLLSEAGW